MPFLGCVLLREIPQTILAFKGRAMDETFVVEVVTGVLVDVKGWLLLLLNAFKIICIFLMSNLF
jgi:hypothetical protein